MNCVYNLRMSDRETKKPVTLGMSICKQGNIGLYYMGRHLFFLVYLIFSVAFLLGLSVSHSLSFHHPSLFQLLLPSAVLPPQLLGLGYKHTSVNGEILQCWVFLLQI